MNGKNQHLVIKKNGAQPRFLLPGYINSVFTSGDGVKCQSVEIFMQNT